MSTDWSESTEGGYTVSSPSSFNPVDLARAIITRPGVHLGSDSFERLTGFVFGLETALRIVGTSDDTAQAPKPVDPSHDEIASLEVALAAALVRLKEARGMIRAYSSKPVDTPGSQS